MSRIPTVRTLGVALSAVSLLSPANAPASDAQTLLNATSWKADYEITFAASSKGSFESLHGPCEYTTSLKRTHSATVLLDMRNPGASISMLKMSAIVNDPSKMSLAEQQKFAMDMVNKINTTANWTHGAGMAAENMSEAEEQAAVTSYLQGGEGTARLSYVQVITGANLQDETGAPYSSVTRTTHEGTGKINPGSQTNFEMDVAAGTYVLMLLHAFEDRDTATVKITNNYHTERPGAAPHDSTDISRANLSSFPARIQVDDTASTYGEGLYITGTFDPAAGKITGERTLKAHYSGFQGDTPGTLVLKYTLTPQ